MVVGIILLFESHDNYHATTVMCIFIPVDIVLLIRWYILGSLKLRTPCAIINVVTC